MILCDRCKYAIRTAIDYLVPQKDNQVGILQEHQGTKQATEKETHIQHNKGSQAYNTTGHLSILTKITWLRHYESETQQRGLVSCW